MKREILDLLFQCAFKEAITEQVSKDQKAGVPPEEVTERINCTFPELALMSQDQIDLLTESVNEDGAKYLYRERNRLSIHEFRKAVGLG